MTTLAERPRAPSGRGEPAFPGRGGRWRRLGTWADVHRVDLAVLTVLLMVTGVVHAVNLHGYPQFFEDEGTYVSQAWALQTRGALSHYTYWYDHPPLGWMQIALWAAPTWAWERLSAGVSVGREAAMLAHAASVVLIYLLGRRTGIRRVLVVIAVLLFALSPLSQYFHRMALLDNMLMPWLLASLYLALSPQRRLAAYAGSGACLAVAVLTKISTGLFLPLALFLIWRGASPENRRYAFTLFLAVFGFLASFWPLLALLKGELWPDTGAWFPGDTRVSLLGTQWYVFFGRTSYIPRDLWLGHDQWLLGMGLLGALGVLATRRYRWIGATYLGLVGLVLLIGLQSYPFIVTFLPFAALAFAGALDLLWGAWRAKPAPARRALAAVGIAAMMAPLLAVPWVWAASLGRSFTHDANEVYRDAVAWVEHNASEDAVILVDNPLWIDLMLAGRDRQDIVWMYKLEFDPDVTDVHPDWRSFDYVISSTFMRSHVTTLPQTAQALANSQPVATFRSPGDSQDRIVVRRVDPTGEQMRRARLAPEHLLVPSEGAGTVERIESDEAVDRGVAVDEGAPGGLVAIGPSRAGADADGHLVGDDIDSLDTASSVSTEADVVESVDPSRPSEDGDPASAAPAVPPPPREERYVIVRGDVLSRIAVRFGTTVDALVEANDLADPDFIRRGRELVIVWPEESQ